MPRSTRSASAPLSDHAVRPSRKKPAKPGKGTKNPRGRARVVLTESDEEQEQESVGDGSDEDLKDEPVNEDNGVSQDATTGNAATHSPSQNDSPAEEQEWFEIKDILRERKHGRRIQYLVDWAADTKGKTYPPSWIPAKDANQEAIDDWKAKKRERAKAKLRARKAARHAAKGKSSSRRATSELQSEAQSDYQSEAQSPSAPQSPRGEIAAAQSQSTEAYQTPSPTIAQRSPSPLDENSEHPQEQPDQQPEEQLDEQPGEQPGESSTAPARPVEPPFHFLHGEIGYSRRSLLTPPSRTREASVDSNASSLATIASGALERLERQSISIELSAAPRNEYLRFSQSESQLQNTLPQIASSSVAPSPVLLARSTSLPSIAPLLRAAYTVVPDSQSDNPGSPSVQGPLVSSQGRSVASSNSQPQFLTQPSALTFSTPTELPTPVQHPASPFSVVPDSILRRGQAARVLAPQTPNPASTPLAAVSVADSLPSAQVSQDLQSIPVPSFSTPSRNTATMDQKKTRTSAVDRLLQARRDAYGPGGLELADNDPALIYEIARLQEDHDDMYRQVAGASSTAAPATSPVLPGAMRASPFLSGDSPSLPQTGSRSPRPSALVSSATTDTPLFSTSGPAEPMVTEQPVAENSAAPTTVAPSDLFSAPPMTTDGLELSPEPEDFVAEEVAPIVQDEPATHGHEDAGPMDADVNDDDDNDDDVDSDDQSPTNPNLTTRDYLVTLPLASNSRQRYIDLVMDPRNKKTIESFGAVFSGDTAQEPDAELVEEVNELLRKLLDLSDLPPYHDSLPRLSSKQSTRYATNTSCKFSFIHEFLDSISTHDKKILILARKGTALAYLSALLRNIRVPFERIRGPAAAAEDDCDDSDSDNDASEGTSGSSLSVVLADTGVDTAALPRDVDIVIGFDHTARASGLLAHYLDDAAGPATTTGMPAHRRGPVLSTALPKPLVLLLVASYTLEHIDLRLDQSTVDDDLERKNALLLCTLGCLTYLQDTAYDDVPGKPHEVAAAFKRLLTNPSLPLEWSPTTLPDDVFDIYATGLSGTQRVAFSQQESLGESVTTSRKRQLQDGEQGGSAAKRMRISESVPPIVPEQSVRLSATAKRALGGGGLLQTGGPTVRISVARLEALAAKVSALQTQVRERRSNEKILAGKVRELEKLLKETTETVNTTQQRLLQTTKERGEFEAAKDQATKEAASLQKTLETRDATVADLKTQNKHLEERLAETTGLLAGSVQPDVQRLAEARSEAATATAQTQQLEKKVRSVETDLGHARRAYQEASNAAAGMGSENRELQARVTELEQQAAENLRTVHELNQSSEAETYRRQWLEMQTALAERERELERAREELRLLKNGRRETRAQSVPRSPRPSVLSPRTVVTSSGRVGGATSLPPVSVGGAGSRSRGNSPVAASFDPSSYSTGNGSGPPGPGFLTPQQGGGRWNHLRD